MFDHIGSKIKALATALCWIGIISCVIAGIAYLSMELYLVGVLVGVVGSLLSWIGSFFAYGFGQLIENTDTIVEQNRALTSNPCPVGNFDAQDVQKDNSTVPYWCGKCGKEGPYEGTCPNCGSSIKNYNVKN